MTVEQCLLAALWHIKKNGPTDRSLGICASVEDMISIKALPTLWKSLYNAIDDLGQQWPEYSGNVLYPVPCPYGGSPFDAFDYTNDLWVGEYSSSRMRLLNFMIRHLEQKSEEVVV